MQYADPVALMLRRDEELEMMTHQKMEEALVEGKTEVVFETSGPLVGQSDGATQPDLG